jgi:hypothetical protein
MSKPAQELELFSTIPTSYMEGDVMQETSFGISRKERGFSEIISEIEEVLNPLTKSLDSGYKNRTDKGSRETKIEELIRKFDEIFLIEQASLSGEFDLPRLDDAFGNLLKVWEGFAIPNIIQDYQSIVAERTAAPQDLSRIKLEREISEEFYSKEAISRKFLSFCKDNFYRPNSCPLDNAVSSHSSSALKSSLVHGIDSQG